MNYVFSNCIVHEVCPNEPTAEKREECWGRVKDSCEKQARRETYFGPMVIVGTIVIGIVSWMVLG